MNIENIANAAQLASALEVSGYPKPGNVHRTADFEDTTFEQFIASSIAIGPALLDVAKKGFRSGKGLINVTDIGVGKAIMRAINETIKWQSGGNTNLGVVMLLIPLTAAAGMTLAIEGSIKLIKLRKILSMILKSTTPKDALDVYDAILMAGPKGLGKVKNLDVKNKDSRDKIKREKISLYNIMKLSSGRDNISKEWVTDMEITFMFGFPHFKRNYKKTRNLNTSTVQTFLHILSRYPDTMVQRIHGRKIASEVSMKAMNIIKTGGILTAGGKKHVLRFDEELRKNGVNPGTTADLVSASLMVAILNGLRP